MPLSPLAAPTARFLCIALAALTLLLYSPSVFHGYIDDDDDEYVFGNPHVVTGLTLENVSWAFHSAYYAANWHPLTWLSHMLDRQLFGARTGPQHFVNILLHSANAALVFLVWQSMTRQPWRSAVVAALFAWHPAHVESVAWIAERKDVLSTFFFLLTLLAWHRHVIQPGVRRYLLVVLFFILGLLAKPMLVTLPFVLLLLDYWPLRRLRAPAQLGRLLVEKIPFFLLAFLASSITWLVQKQAGAVVPLEVVSIPSRLGNAALSYARYAGKLVWPTNLILPYQLDGNPDAALAALAGLGVIVALIVVIERGGRDKYLPVGLFWFLGTLVPVIGLVQVGSQSMADRYTYVPFIGLSIALVWAVADLLPRRVCALAAAIMLAGLAFLTARQLSYWKNGITLFSHTLEVDPRNLSALNALAWNYATYPDLQLRDPAKAVALAQRCVDATRRRVPAFLDTLAAAEAEAGHFEKAIAISQEALAGAWVKEQPLFAELIHRHIAAYQANKTLYAP